jgi:hypothetical protein
MAEFSGKVVDAYYFSEDYTMIEVIYKNDNNEMVSYVLEANPEHSDMQDLEADGWTVEKLAESTVEYKKQQSTAFSEAIQKQVDEIINESQMQLKKKLNNLEQQIHIKSKMADEELYDKIISSNEDNDSLFKFKLWLLEQPNIKKADRKVKTDIRKAKTIVEGFAILHGVSSSS